MGINQASMSPQKRTTRRLRFEGINEDQGKAGPLFDFPPGVALQKLPGSDTQTLFQTQDIIRA
jgi:hypothetical protein